MIIYFCFVLIDLVNDYKNIYSRSVCMMVFMRIISMKSGYKMVFYVHCYF